MGDRTVSEIKGLHPETIRRGRDELLGDLADRPWLAGIRRSDWLRDHRLPVSAGHFEMESHRASALQSNLADLGRLWSGDTERTPRLHSSHHDSNGIKSDRRSF